MGFDGKNKNTNLSNQRRMKFNDCSAEKVQQTYSYGRMIPHTLVHDQYAWFDVHDAVLFRRVKQPIPKQGKVTVRRSYT